MSAFRYTFAPPGAFPPGIKRSHNGPSDGSEPYLMPDANLGSDMITPMQVYVEWSRFAMSSLMNDDSAARHPCASLKHIESSDSQCQVPMSNEYQSADAVPGPGGCSACPFAASENQGR